MDAKKDEVNMTKSDYLRNAILFAPAGERAKYNSVFAEEMRRDINVIGIQINEIAHAVNGRREVIPKDIKVLMEEYAKLMTVYDIFVRENVDTPY